MRDGGLGEAHEGREIADAALAVGQRVDQSHSRRISQEFEHVRDGFTVRPASRRSWSWRDGRGIAASGGALAASGHGRRRLSWWRERGCHKV